MDDQERDEILYRLDERMERIDGNLMRFERRLQAVEDVADDAYQQSDDNRQNINAFVKITTGLGTFLTAVVGTVSAKLTGLL